MPTAMTLTADEKGEGAGDAPMNNEVVAAAADGPSEESRKDQAAAEIMATLIAKPTPPPPGPNNANPPAASAAAAAAAVVPHRVSTASEPPPERASVPKKAKVRPSAASIAAEAAAAWAAKQRQLQKDEQRKRKRMEVGGGGKAKRAVAGRGNAVGEGKKQPPSKKARGAAGVPTKTATTTATTVAVPASTMAATSVSLPPAPTPAAVCSAALRQLGDAEFVRVMALEFKRRGYAAALRIETRTSPGQELGEEKGGGEGDGGSAAPPASTMAEANQVPKEGKKKRRTKDRCADAPTPLSLPSFPFHPSTVVAAEKNVESWNAMFGRLRSYHDANGGALPLLYIPPAANGGTSTTADDDAAKDKDNADLALYKWTRAQLSLWKRMKRDDRHNLSLDRIAMLHSLNFNRAEDIDKDIKARVLLSSSGEGGGDGGLHGIMRDGATGEIGEGDDKNKQLMMMMAVPAGRNVVKWQEKFEMLKKYKEENDDTNVPRSYDDRLSKWCAVQRMRCKEFMAGDPKTPMTKAQYQALRGIGFNMDDKRKRYDRSVIDKKWEDKFNELIEYKEKYGNCEVAVRKGFEEYKQLANWAGLMRRKYKARQTGTKAGRTTGITDEQIKKLASCGFSFSLQDDFDTRFRHLLEFKKEFGHTKVPVFYTGHNNLGRWAKRMRDGIRNGDPWMDDMRKSRLLGIDFDISVRHVFGHKASKKCPDDGSDALEDSTTDGYARGDEAIQAEEALVAQQIDDNDFGRPSLPPLHHGPGEAQYFYGSHY